MTTHPFSLSEFQDLAAFEPTLGGQVEVCDGRLQGKVGGFDTSVSAVVGSAGEFKVD